MTTASDRHVDTDVDVLIVGGGLVGASLAIALDGSRWRVGLVEAAAPASSHGVAGVPDQNQRYLALARASLNALEALQVWPHIAAQATPIRAVRISRQGEFGSARLDVADHGVAAFGATVPARELGRGLSARLASCAALQRLAPATLVALDAGGDAVTATLRTDAGERRVRARLIVGADGTASFVRGAMRIGTDDTDYAQTAFVCNVSTERAIDGVGHERFTATGPLALLPLGERRAGVIFTVPSADTEVMAALDDAGFCAALQARFGARLGKFSRPGPRVSYPLRRVVAQQVVAPRCALVGNAAQTLHPIAAQGFNLGLRDALTLAELLIDAGADADPGAAALLAQHAARRADDRDGTAAFSDGLARWTRSEALPLKLLRPLGLFALDHVPPLQGLLARRGMGFRGAVPRLALRDAQASIEPPA